MKKLFIIFFISIFVYSNCSNASNNGNQELLKERESLHKSIQTNGAMIDSPTTINRIIEIDRQLKSKENLIKFYTDLINRSEIHSSKKIIYANDLAKLFRQTGKYNDSEKTLLNAYSVILKNLNNDYYLEALFSKILPALLITLKQTKTNTESINLFSQIIKDFQSHPLYISIHQYISIAYISQFSNTQKRLKNLKFKTLTNKDFDISDYAGKYVLVDFWATWCPPCQQELPGLKKIYDKYNSHGFEIIGISLDNNLKTVENYIKRNNVKWQNYFDGLGWHNKIAMANSITSVPSIFLLDKNGDIMFSNLRNDMLAIILEELFDK